MSGQGSLRCSTKASSAYTSAHPGKRANVFSFHHKMENGFLLLSSLALFIPIFPYSLVQLCLSVHEVELYACDCSHVSQNKAQGTAPRSMSFFFISERPILPITICTGCSTLILHSSPFDNSCVAYHNK